VQVAEIAAWCAVGALPDGDAFYRALTEEDGKFTELEGAWWDFKDEWPFSRSNEHFAGICRLACAFANSRGGIIVFGVDDRKRTGGHNKVNPNIDSFLQAFQQLTGVTPNLDFRHYEDRGSGAVDVLLIKRRLNGVRPIRFIENLGGYGKGIIWVRSGHEVVAAAPNHFPVVFCGADLSEDIPQRDGSLPPSLSTIKKFVGRVEVIDRLFDWIQNSDEPRTYLYGKGGSGKTTIGYEFARLLKDYGTNIRIEGSDLVDVVIFISAKEKYLVSSTSDILDINEPDFSDERSLLTKILFYGGWTPYEKSLESQDLTSLRNDLKEYLDIVSALIVIDDVDTLTTQGIDPGSDFLYRTLSRSTKKSKILYTLRNAPSQSLHSSIEVPGLSGDDYDEFVLLCSRQFGVKEPSRAFRDGRLAELSERRPLVIESIVALVRTSLSYERAADLFAQHSGDNVRDYVFIREWDALAGDSDSRFLLSALADMGEGASFRDIQTVLQVDETRVRDAIGQVREMFLQIDEVGEEARFSLAPLTRSFVSSRQSTLKGYHIVRERVRAFKQNIRISSPAVVMVITRVQRLLPMRDSAYSREQVLEALRVVTDPALSAGITQDPIFRAAFGFVCALQQPPRLTEAREAFEYCLDMRREPDFGQLIVWFNAERNSGAHDDWCIKIADVVISGRRYTEVEKISMLSRKATSLHARARHRIFTDQTDAHNDFMEALNLHLKTFRFNSLRGDIRTERSEDYARNTAHQWFDLILKSDAPWEIFERVRKLTNTKDVFLDPIEKPLTSVMERILRTHSRPEVINRIRNNLKGLPEALERREQWLDRTVSQFLRDAVRSFDQGMADRLKR
jgi:ABC-type oligopeptide transport system ATPase subunit